MSENKIEEIRARHSRDERWRNTLPQMHEDRATLLAEVDRQRAEIERLLQAVGLATTTVPDMQIDIENPIGMMQRVVAEVDRQRAEVERLKPLALGGWAGDSDPAAVLSKVEKQRAEIERLRAEVQRQTRHVEQLYDQIRRRADERDKAQIGVERLRKALQDIAEDCDDDYPPSHGAIKYAVQDALRDKP